jgi:hypothetical protein
MLLAKEQIAKIAHEINLAYCAALGDTSQPPWEEAPEWQKASALAGVEMHLANPLATPEQSHESWLAQKVAEGWVYGEVKDPAKKQHPCCLPYAQLPIEQRAKDYLFRAVVHQMAELPAPVQPLAKIVSVAPDVKPATAMIGVRYVGRRDTYKDGLYGTGIVFEQGEAKLVPAAKALQMLRHADVYAPVDDQSEATAAPAAATDPKDGTKNAEEERIQEMHDSLEPMTKDALVSFAQTHNIAIDAKAKKDDVKAAIKQHMDQFGVAW